MELAEQALEADPKLLEAHELLARLALEDNDEAQAIARGRQGHGHRSPRALEAMAIRATIDWLRRQAGDAVARAAS